MLPLLCTISPAVADPPPGPQWQPIPELTDEFDGNELDVTKWHDHNPIWLGRQPAFFSQKNVSISGGQLRLTARAESLPDAPPDYTGFTTAAVQSLSTVLYGYFEIRAQAMKSAASSTFWLNNHQPDWWTEIDVFEIGARAKGLERKYFMTAHLFQTPAYRGTPDDHRNFPQRAWNAPYDLAGEYHVYGLKWDENEINWYVDGNLLRSLPNTYWHQPLYMNFDSEIMPNWFGIPDKRDLPSTFSIDYVRSWRKSNSSQTSSRRPPLLRPDQRRFMRMDAAHRLLGAAGAIFNVLGFIHALLTLRDLRNPRAFTPTDDHVRSAMENAVLALNPRANLWRAWLGFNFSHSLGVIAFGGWLLMLASIQFPLFADNLAIEGATVAVAALYVTLSLRYWFWIPAISSGAALLCIVSAVLCCATNLIPL